MQKNPWTAERVKSIQEYRTKNNVTIEQAAKDLKFSVGNYYVNKKKYETQVQGPRAYRKPSAKSPITLELTSPTNKNRVVIMIADRSQIQSILSEVF